jgi:hypothetical protein
MVVVLIALVLNAWPFWGYVHNDPLHPYVIPDAYYKLRDFLQSQHQNFRVFVAPASQYASYIWYNWSPESDTWNDVLPEVTSTAFVRALPQTGWQSNLVDSVYNALKYNDTRNVAKILQLMNVKYLLVRSDGLLVGNVTWQYDLDLNPSWVIQVIQHQETHMPLAVSFDGFFVLFEVPNYLPPVYASDGLIQVAGNESALTCLSNDSSLDFTRHVFVFRNESIPGFPDNETAYFSTYLRPSRPPTQPDILLNYTEIDPSLYEVTIRNARPTLVVLNVAYDPGWSAVAPSGEKLYHFVANGYANGFFLNHEGVTRLRISFAGQRFLVMGSGVTIATLVACASWLFLTTLRRRKRRFEKP